MKRFPVLAFTVIGILAVGCSPSPGPATAGTAGGPLPAASTGVVASPPGPIGAADVDGPFRLELVLPRTTWSTTDEIEAQATLRYLLPMGVELGGAGSGLLGFSAIEVGGTRRMDAGWQADCARWNLAADAPITSGLTKGGGWSADDPNAAFYEAFFADPEYHLPPGRWLITAHAVFAEGPDCRGAQHDLRASREITVTD